MNRYQAKLCLALLLLISTLCWPSAPAWSDESVGQERVAYLQLTRLRTLSTSGGSYGEYKDAVGEARMYVELLRGSDATVSLLRRAMSYYEQALSVWGLQADSPSAVDSLRSDQPVGAGILVQCPDIARFPYKQREQIYVKDALNCLWRIAADVLAKAPDNLR